MGDICQRHQHRAWCATVNTLSTPYNKQNMTETPCRPTYTYLLDGNTLKGKFLLWNSHILHIHQNIYRTIFYSDEQFGDKLLLFYYPFVTCYWDPVASSLNLSFHWNKVLTSTICSLEVIVVPRSSYIVVKVVHSSSIGSSRYVLE